MVMGPIRGKVAQILDSRQLVINVGSSQDVAVNMIFKILNPKGEQIRDPDTQQILGSIESPRAFVRVIQVQDNLSVATTSVAGPVFSPVTLGPIARALMPPRWVDQYESLTGNLSSVNIGDPAVQVIPTPIQ